MSVNEKMTAIADNIRNKTGRTDSLSLDEMLNGVNEVFESGKKARADEWWDNYLAPMRAGRPTPYLFAGGCWNGNTFYPTQDIVIKENGQGLFNRFSWNSNVPSIDLAQRLEECGVKLDVSKATTLSTAFSFCWVTRLPSLDLQTITALGEMFTQSRYLVTIDELIIREDGTNTFVKTFNDTFSLTNIKIKGTIGTNISFSSSPLSVDSLKSVITALKDYSGTSSGYAYTVTFKTSAFDTLEEEETTAEYNGEPCTWAELIDNKKWNLVKG